MNQLTIEHIQEKINTVKNENVSYTLQWTREETSPLQDYV